MVCESLVVWTYSAYGGVSGLPFGFWADWCGLMIGKHSPGWEELGGIHFPIDKA